MKICFIALCSFLLLNCQPRQSRQQLPEVVKHPFQSTLSSLGELIQKIEIIPLKSQDDVVFGSTLRTLHRDSCYYIGDRLHSKLIYRFHEDGRFMNTIGAQGKGPGEYLSLNDFYVDDTADDIFTISYPEFRLYHFSKNGQFKGMKKQQYNPGSFIKNNNTFWVYGGNNNGYMPEQIVQFDSNLNLLNKYYPLETKTIHISLGPVFNQWKDEIYLVMGFDPHIYQISGDSLYPVIHFDFGQREVPETYWKSTDFMQALQELQNKGFCNIQNVMVNDDYILSEQNEQLGSNNMQIWYICSIKHKNSGKWYWIRKATSDGGMVVNGQKTKPADLQPEWYMYKIQGFAKDGRLIIIPDLTSLENMPAKDKALISNPEILETLDPETDTVLFLCTLK